MVNQKLLEKVNKLGVPMMVPEENVDVNKTLAEVVKSQDTRLWENFPVLLVNANKKGTFQVKEVEKYLTNKDDRRMWRSLLKMSLALYPVMQKNFEFAKKMEEELSMDESKWVEEFRSKARMRSNDHFKLEKKEFSFSRLKTFLDDYLQDEAVKAQRNKAMHDELSLEYALSQVFSPKQKELFNKKLKGEKLTKTEREYFSRAVKKKVQTLANPDLHRLAMKVLR